MIQTRIEATIKRRSKKPGFDFSEAPDNRQEGKVTHERKHILNSLLLYLVLRRLTGAAWSSVTAVTVPSLPMVILVAFSGTLMFGSRV